MRTRKVTIRVVCDLPDYVGVSHFKEYIKDAVTTMGGAYEPDDFFFDPDFRNSIIVKSPYNRKPSS